MEESIGTDPSTITLREVKAEEVIVLSFETSEIKLEQALKLKAIAVIPAKIAVLTFFMKNLQRINYNNNGLILFWSRKVLDFSV